MKRYIILMSLLFFFGCQSSILKNKKNHQILRTCLTFDIVSLDPRKGVNMSNQGVIRMLFTGLVRLDKQMIPQLELAESYQASSDFKTYVFILKDCAWSDGSPITAHDFERSWKAALTPPFASANTNLFLLLKNGKQILSGQASIDQLGVKALNDKTLQVELEQSNPHFLNVLINCVFAPVHSSMQNATPNENRFICSGPFQLKKRVFQDQIILEKNPHYWNASQVQLQELHYYIIKDSTTALLMFEKKEIDWMGDPLIRIPSDAIPKLKTSGLLYSSAAAGSQWMYLNTDRFPLSNSHIRHALAYALDREKIIRNILHLDESKPSLGLISKILKKERWHPWFQDHDVAQAKKTFQEGLKELGIKADQFPTLTILTTSSHNKIIQAIQQMWQEALGIKVAIEVLDAPILINRYYGHDFDMTWSGWLLQYNDPVNMLETFKYKNMQPNYTGWEHPAFIQHADACSKATTEEEKWSHVEAAEAIFYQDMPSIPIFDFTLLYIKQPYVKGVLVNQLFHVDFDRAYIEQNPTKY